LTIERVMKKKKNIYIHLDLHIDI